jgi:NADH:ubiquinone oxidoreductase subunit
MRLMDFLTRFFTWWNGTQLWASRFGEFVGEDEYANRYYRTKGGRIDPALGFDRRWVIYKGLAEASTIGPAWHGWMHHTVDNPPPPRTRSCRRGGKPHRPNLTGTDRRLRRTGGPRRRPRHEKKRHVSSHALPNRFFWEQWPLIFLLSP